jgi:hypothetical protein
MGESAFFLGRGPAARILGVVAYRPSPHFGSDTVRPGLLRHLAAGRRALTAADPGAYTAAVEELLVEWRITGKGHAESAGARDLESDPHYASPNTDGTWPGPAPAGHRPRYDAAYAYDDRQLLWWNDLRWRPLSLADTIVHMGPAVRTPLLARPYGGHPDTAALTLRQVAVWIMAELATRAMDTDCALPPQLRFAALVNPARHEIRFTAFGLRDADHIEYSTAPASEVIPHLVQPIIQSHNQTSADDPSEQRFRAEVVVPGERRQDQERDQGRGPGTVTVIDTINPIWWT